MNDNHFYSIDKLVEFGLGMSVASQMVNMMNQGMRNMYIPGSIQSMPQGQQQQQPIAQPVQQIYVGVDGMQVGPLTSNEFSELVRTHKVTKDTLAWLPGMPAWKPVSEVPELLKVIALTPPPLPTAQ